MNRVGAAAKREALEIEHGHYVSGGKPESLQAYAWQFRHKSTTFVMAFSIAGMMGHSGTFDAAEWQLRGYERQQRWLHRRGPPSWRGTGGRALRARHQSSLHRRPR